MTEYEGGRAIRVVGRGAYGVVHLCATEEGRHFIRKEIPVNEMSVTERQSAVNEVPGM